MAGGGIYLEVDASDLKAEIERIRAVTTPERFNQVMYSIFKRTGGHVRGTLKRELPSKYHVKAGEVGSAVGSPKLVSSGMGVGCTIPIRGTRGSIGGRYRASGGRHGWRAVRGGKYNVKARIVKSGQSTLPSNAGSYGGMPPFRNFDAPTLNGVTFTRAGKDRLPIMKMSGIAIPQMPMNRSRGEVQDDIKNYMQKRMEHEFQRLISGGR